ncbi:MAG: DUF3806 domain-containing protein [bacterium]|nr:DUF3806 domain-containing protein [Gammaproteobacteria bacterium]HIL98995.1 DUF3806 domain-containing protein [Pseudomonadales bacterium]
MAKNMPVILLVIFTISTISTTALAEAVDGTSSEEHVTSMTQEELEKYSFEEEENDVFIVTALSHGQLQLMDAQRLMAKDLLARKVGVINVRGNKQDIASLQQIIDRRGVRSDQIDEWQAMGVLFGDIIATEFNMVWVRYEDKFGIAKALRWRETDNFVFPVPIFSKRVQYLEKIDVQAIYDQVSVDIERFKAWERKPKLPNANKSS